MNESFLLRISCNLVFSVYKRIILGNEIFSIPSSSIYFKLTLIKANNAFSIA